jgi:molybdenum cofactor cytidylyltransferase
MLKTGIILLAAGAGSRMGSPKQLLPFHGQPLIRHATNAAIDSGCSPIAVVLGSAADKIRPALLGLDLILTENPLWADGMGTSIQAGLRALEPHSLDAVILTLTDQPLLSADIYRRLRTEFERTHRSIVTSEYSGTVGVPVLFGRQHFGELMALEPDRGCKGVILHHKNIALRIPCPEAEFDLDTPQDYQRIQAMIDAPSLSKSGHGHS